VTQGLGRGLVVGMPYFLKVLSAVGTAAMLWVGGGIIVHGLEGYGLPVIGHTIHDLAVAAGHAVPAVAAAVEWLVTAAGSGLVGLALGAALIPLVHRIALPVLARIKGTKAEAGAARAHGPHPGEEALDRRHGASD
jgi:predicted DNA repair protein MutK